MEPKTRSSKRMQSQTRNRFDLVYQLRNLARRVTPFMGQPQASSRPGMGAVPHHDGTTFRVWAPHAHAVSVAGTFNKWSFDRHPLTHEGNGYWSTEILQALVDDEYKFVIRNGHEIVRTDPYARRVTGDHRNSIVVSPSSFDWQGDTFKPAPKNELVIYELHVGTFDEMASKPPGHFAGVIEKLPYLQKMGFNAIELMPIKEFDGQLSWGYNPAHPFAVEEHYGGPDALKELVRTAHQHNIAVILDVVYNHFGPEDLSLWQFDGWSENDKGGIYFYNDWRSKTPWADTRPDYGRTEVRRFIRDNVMMWFEEYHVDGLRWDATSYIRNANGRDGDEGADLPDGWRMMQEISAEIRAKYPNKLLIAEDLQSNPRITQPDTDDGAGFDTQWDAQFVHPIRAALIDSDDAKRDIQAVADALTFQYNSDVFERVIYTESHDEVANGKARVTHEIAPELGDSADSYYAKKRAVLGAALVFTAPGIPMIFQGQEFLADGWFRDDVMLDWAKARKHSGMLQLFRDLLRLRRNMRGTTQGLTGQHINVYHVNDDDKLLAFHRWDAGGRGDDVVVVANFANVVHESYRIGLPNDGCWQLRFNSDLSLYDEDFSDLHVRDLTASPIAHNGLPYSATLTVAPYTALIFSQ